jgi:hypothetical protein
MSLNLSNLFSKVAIKTLAKVDLPMRGSNQHEINGVQDLRDFFQIGERTQISNVKWYYFADGEEISTSIGNMTFYDAREGHITRTEWRLYYDAAGATILEFAVPDDVLILAKTANDEVISLVFKKDSDWLNIATYLFNAAAPGKGLKLLDESSIANRQIDFSVQRILEILNIDVVIPSTPNDEQLVFDKFKLEFPTTWQMSALAREKVDVDTKNPDETLVRWLQREEELFRALEKQIVQKRLEQQFESVDDFVTFSLSVQNRRKSRMGHALENHLRVLFDNHNLKYSHNKNTEGKKKPDFIFPSIESYHDENFDSSRLIMLGAKSSCKERWRQVLSEADRIPYKHLCTLEPGISKDQTDEMKDSKLTLVVPVPLHNTYTATQLNEIWSLEDFMKFVKKHQA